MNIFEWYKLRNDNVSMSDEDFSILVWKKNRESIRETVTKFNQEKLQKQVEDKINKELDKNLDDFLEKAFMNGKSSLDIKINI